MQLLEATLYSKLLKCFYGEENLTSLKRRLDNVLLELDIIRQGLGQSGQEPPCCLNLHKDGRINCDAFDPLSRDEFLKKCRECRTRIKKLLAGIDERRS